MELIATDAQRLQQDEKVFLFEIDATSKGQGVLRFSPAVQGASWEVQFGGNTYRRLAIEAEGFEYSGSGTAPRPTLTLVASDLMFLALIINSDDLVGCPVRRIKTYRKYLDDGVAPNPGVSFPVDHYTINRKAKQVRKLLQFELVTKMEQAGRKVPAKQVIRDTCLHQYRYWSNGKWNYEGVTCPYAGAAEFDASGNPVTDMSKGRCGKMIPDCDARFGENNPLPMFAFPGVDRIS